MSPWMSQVSAKSSRRSTLARWVSLLLSSTGEKSIQLNGNLSYILLSISTDEAFKAAAYLTESIIKPGKLPFQHAFNTDQQLWEWIEAPTHQPYITRLQLAMEGTSKVEPPNAIVAGELQSSIGLAETRLSNFLPYRIRLEELTQRIPRRRCRRWKRKLCTADRCGQSGLEAYRPGSRSRH